jgi:hypothetical protein
VYTYYVVEYTKITLKLSRFWNYGNILPNILKMATKRRENADSDIGGSIQTLSREFCVDGVNVMVTLFVSEYSITNLL